MVIGLDIDGVLADSVASFLQLLNALYRGNWTLEDVVEYQFEDALGLSRAQIEHFWKLFARQGRWGRIEPLPGAIRFTRELADKYAVVLITGRPRHYVEVETKAWLRQHRFAYDDLIFLGANNKLDASREAGYQLDLFVEDSYEYSKPLADAGVEILLMDYPYNRNVPAHPNITRVTSFDDIRNYITAFGIRKKLEEHVHGTSEIRPAG